MSCNCTTNQIIAQFLPQIYELIEKKSKEFDWFGHTLTVLGIVIPILYAILTQGFKVNIRVDFKISI